MPSCAGHDKRADTAMHAAICAHHYRWRGDERNAATGDLQYGRAMELLRTDLNTDDAAILTIAILTCYVFLMRGKAYSLEAVAHINGVASIMRARPKTVQTSALASAILFCLAEEYFRFACIFGTPSPFDDERWLDLEPSELYGPLSSEVRSLRKLSHKLVLRLPRLIAAVRVCRENGQHASFADAFQLAEELWQLGDDETETHLLHQVKVVPTQDPDVCKIVAYSFSFHSTEQLIAAALYWWTRLMTINLCSKLHHLCPNNQASAKSSLPHHPDLTHEQTRLIANMIMSWQHATSSGQTRWLPSFVQTMEALWVALSDLETFRDLPVETTRSLVLRRYKEVLHEQPIEVTPELIESMGGLLVGGPIDGPASMVGLIERHYGQSF